MRTLIPCLTALALIACAPTSGGDDESFRGDPSGAGGGNGGGDVLPGGGTPAPGTDVSTQSIVVKADGEPIGYAQTVSEHIVYIFDPNKKILFGVNDTTGHVTGVTRTADNPALADRRWHQGEACRGASIGYDELRVAEDLEIQVGVRCEDDYYQTRDRRSLTAFGGDGFGRTAGTAITYARRVKWPIASIYVSADRCLPANPDQPQCIVERSTTDIIPVTFPLPISLHAGETIESRPGIEIGAQ